MFEAEDVAGRVLVLSAIQAADGVGAPRVGGMARALSLRQRVQYSEISLTFGGGGSRRLSGAHGANAVIGQHAQGKRRSCGDWHGLHVASTRRPRDCPALAPGTDRSVGPRNISRDEPGRALENQARFA
jgi:hypothetical protein